MSAPGWVYTFGNGRADGHRDLRELLGGKGANLAEMSLIGLPVPPGFTITTQACKAYYAAGGALDSSIEEAIGENLRWLQQETRKGLGDRQAPLLVSVRSGAQESMPGMMDTVLNLGLNDTTVLALAEAARDERFAWDSYRRFIQMYASVVMGVEHDLFEDRLARAREAEGVSRDHELSAAALQALVAEYRELVEEEAGTSFPQDSLSQLLAAVKAVFSSWMSQRAVTYRRLYQIPEEWGTAVTVQSMVFGNMGPDCATGVAFTRNPSTGAREFFGEYLINAQGEDVVAGIRTPYPLTAAARQRQGGEGTSMEEALPETYAHLERVRDILEGHFKDLQDIEFTVEKNRLYVLQTRRGKRSAAAALKVACDMTCEGLISQDEALMRIDPQSLDQLLHPRIDPDGSYRVLASGLPASPGAASGIVCLSADEVESKARQGHKALLVRAETSPEDVHGMHAAVGILTTRGGMTSHAAVVARGMGRPCVVGIDQLSIHEDGISFGDTHIKSGSWLTIDGSSGEVLAGKVGTVRPELSEDFTTMMTWADSRRRLQVRTNAETVADIAQALEFGAEGIGLCRTEHMFFDRDRISAMRAMIMAETQQERIRALDQILPMQRTDFVEIFNLLQRRPVTIRLLDPPLHEFLPHTESELQDFAREHGVSLEKVRVRTRLLQETNPMLGHRGCRLLLSYPEITMMQARAIFEAWISIESTERPDVEIMIPLVGHEEELIQIRTMIEDVAHTIGEDSGVELVYTIGTMVELPRAALLADRLAKAAEFFSFGTNDLTQTTLGISRDDSGGFLENYSQKGIFDSDPFVKLDQEGVGQLVRLGVEQGRQVRPDIKVGICGEHGGDPDSILFCHRVGLDYVSCSPFRVPIARLAAAQAQIGADRANGV